ncbi:MAG: pitrilysin family protein [Thermodesulfovibrionales bacterium]|nr:pitrilysin family protein [Thermodesulfovibrionales bacterium]
MGKKRILVSLMLAACWFLSSQAFAIDSTRTVLPNGLIVLHSENHNLPIVMVTLIVRAGQVHEPGEKAGLANVTAELLSEGTKARSSKEISEALDFIGASLGISAGADYTTLTLSVLKKDIQKGFDIFSDVLLHPSFPQEEITRVKELIKGSLKHREEDPSFLAGRAFRKEVFGTHPYGRLMEGSAETIDFITREDMMQFHSAYFLPNNAILSVAGDLTPEELQGMLQQYLNEWKKAVVPLTVFGKPAGKPGRSVLKIEKDLTQATLMLGNLGIRREDPDYYAVSVMNYILGGGGFSSRLMRSIRDEKGLAYDVQSFFAAQKESGYYQISLQTKNESANTALAEIITQVKRITAEPVSDEELSEAKSFLTGNFLRRLDTNRKIADFFAAVEFYALGLDYRTNYPGYINAVTKEDILRVARKYLSAEQYVLAVVADQKKAGLQYPEK